MKKTVAGLLALALLLTLLPACGKSADPGQDICVSPEPPPALDTAKAISAAGEEPEGGVEILDGQLGEYIEAAYGLDAGNLKDSAVLRGTGALAYEIAVLYFADEAGANDGEKALKAYLPGREGAFTGYAPQQASLVAAGQVRRDGNHVGLFICEDAEAAGDLFAHIIDVGMLPEAAPGVSETTPGVSEATPGISEAAPGVSKAMRPLAEALLNCCQEEIDSINAAGGMVSIAASNVTDGFAETVESIYGIAPDLWEDGFFVHPVLPGSSLFELAVFRMTDQVAAVLCADMLWAYKEGIKDRFCERGSDGTVAISKENEAFYTYVSGAHITRINEYLALVICQDAEEASEAFSEACHTMLRPEGPPPEQADSESVEIADGVSVTEVPWKPAEGEPDPDNPERIRFVPSGDNVNMQLYDTSAIVSAWESGDPSGLPEYDRAIYDGAKAVLEEILTDGMSGFEKEVEIYDWVLRNVTYDWSHMDVLNETARDAYTPYSGLVNGAAVCLGYASTFQLLMELAGEECITVIGAGGAGNDHAWNMVKLDGEWYCTDATWEWSFYDAGMMDGREWRFFNVTTDYMLRTNHQWAYGTSPEAVAVDYGVG